MRTSSLSLYPTDSVLKARVIVQRLEPVSWASPLKSSCGSQGSFSKHQLERSVSALVREAVLARSDPVQDLVHISIVITTVSPARNASTLWVKSVRWNHMLEASPMLTISLELGLEHSRRPGGPKKLNQPFENAVQVSNAARSGSRCRGHSRSTSAPRAPSNPERTDQPPRSCWTHT